MKNKIYNFWLKIRYGKKRLQRLRDRSFPYVGSITKLAEMDDAELIRHLKKVWGEDFESFFKKSINTPMVEIKFKKTYPLGFTEGKKRE